MEEGKKGLNVVLTGRDGDALGRAAATLAQPEDRVMTVRMDVTNVGSIKSALHAVESRFGRVDVLVNNAAVLLCEDEDVLSIPSEGYARRPTSAYRINSARLDRVPKDLKSGNMRRGAGSTAALRCTPSVFKKIRRSSRY